MDLTPTIFALFLTASGAPIASTAIWMAIDFVKNSPLSRFVVGNEKNWAFLGSFVIVVLAILVGLWEAPPRWPTTSALEILAVVLLGLGAFYNIGRLAMAVHDDVNRKPNSLTT